MFYLDFGNGIEWDVTGRRLRLSLGLHNVAPEQLVEVGGQVAAQQRLALRDGQQRGQQLGVEARFVHEQSTVNARSAHVGRVLGQVDSTQPFHDPVVGPQRHLTGRRLCWIFGHGTPLQALRVVIVQTEHLFHNKRDPVMERVMEHLTLKVNRALHGTLPFEESSSGVPADSALPEFLSGCT